MTRRLPLFLFVALVAATLTATAPLAAQTSDPQPPQESPTPAEPPTESLDETAVGERVERSEEGTIQGSIVLLDADNLIVETADGDRAFSIGEASELPAELRDAAAWASYRGVPVRVSFAPGDEGELRVVRSLSLLSDGTTTTTTTTETAETGAVDRPFVTRTDVGDDTDVVEPTAGSTDGTATAEGMASSTRTEEGTVTTTTADGRTSGQLIADATDDPAADDGDTAAGFAADDSVPPGERMASLPATASSLPWLALIGTLALVGALGLGRLESLRRRVTVGGERR
jgi:hypothetical protein